MGFFSAVKKFFGGGTEETKETQAAAVEKEAAHSRGPTVGGPGGACR